MSAAITHFAKLGDERLERKGSLLQGLMATRASVCLRQLADGARSGIVGYWRFFANSRVTVEKLIEGWGPQTSAACAGRHILAIQDTSEINFATTARRRRGLGKIGKGNGHGLLLHPMLAVDAGTGALLGLVTGKIWTRTGKVKTAHRKRKLADKESERWVTTPEAARKVLSEAAMVTEVSDREGDFYAKWARLPSENFHILTRAMHDRAIVEPGRRLSKAALEPAGHAVVELRERPERAARKAHLVARFGPVTLKRPGKTAEKGLPETVAVSLVEVVEVNAPAGVKPIVWRLLTTHDVRDAAMAWQIVNWYRMRWTIEQFFRTLKQQGLKLEDSQLESAERLIKLTAMAARAACIIMQLVQARDGQSAQMASIVFTPGEIETMTALMPGLEGKTALQKNPHPPLSMAWMGWGIAKMGGWDGYPKSRKPGPITFRNGFQRFQAMAQGWSLAMKQR